MKDKPTNAAPTPQTGDRGWKLALAVFGVSLGGVIISFIISRKRKEEK